MTLSMGAYQPNEPEISSKKIITSPAATFFESLARGSKWSEEGIVRRMKE